MTNPEHAPQSALATGSPRWRVLPTIAIAAVVGLGFAALYDFSGIADLHSTPPLTPIGRADASAVDRLAVAMQSQGNGGQPQAQSRTALGSVDEMIARLIERLNGTPNDPEGWRMLGWSYFNTGRFADSAVAYAKAIELKPDNAEFRSSRGEALVKAADERVTEDAKLAFEEALRLDAKNAHARVFLGLAKAQAGDKSSALEDWIAILNETDSNEAWVTDLRQRVAELGQETGIDVSARLHRPQIAGTGGTLDALTQEHRNAPPPGTGPSTEDVRDAEAMPATDRMATIRGMVERLASRLDQSPQDVDGWIRLIRSRKILGEDEAARLALQRALAAFEHAPRQQGEISAAARELGLAR